MIVYNHPAVTAYACEKIGEDDWGPHFNVGLVQDDKLVAACILNYPTGLDVNMNVAVENKRIPPEFLRAMFDTVFNKMGCTRVTCYVEPSNKASIKLTEHVGFVKEGVKRLGAGDKDLVMYGMIKSECRWIEQEKLAA